MINSYTLFKNKGAKIITFVVTFALEIKKMS